MSLLNDIKVQIDVVRDAYSDSSWSKKTFPYPHHRIYYVYDGEATLILNNSKHILKPGYMYLLPAFSLVETICVDHLYHYYVHFSLHHHDIIDLFTIYNPCIEIPVNTDIRQTFELLEANYKADTLYSNMISFSSLYKLLAPFFENCSLPSPEVMRFEPVLNYIDNNLDTKLTNETLAKLLDLDPVYFSNLFSKTFSCPPSQYIIKKRLDKAQTLLHTTDYKINKISELLGFDTNMYFSKLFKSKVGVTPSDYRHQVKS